MIIITLCEKEKSQLEKKFQEAVKKADLVEIRCDFFSFEGVEKIKDILVHPKVLVTLRSSQEGGECYRKTKDRHQVLKEIIDLGPFYLDLEYARDKRMLKYANKVSKKTKVILSYHNPSSFPPHLSQKLHLMRKYPAWKYKIAVLSNSILESLKMLSWVQKNKDFIGICMGEKGKITRILGPLYHQPISYCYLGEQPAALGQLTYDELESLYRYRSLNSKTKLLGIIGTPLWQSPGYKTYNPLFQKEKINAVYLNFELKEEELSSFFRYAKTLKFLGLSVTSPFKESVLKYTSSIHPKQKKIGSLNTLLFKKEGLIGLNTDGIAALELLKQGRGIENKKVLIFGAGGVALGVGYILKTHKALLTFTNRTNSKAKELAQEFGAHFQPYELLSSVSKDDYDIIIQTTPVGNSNPDASIVPEHILDSKKHVLDVAFNETKLLKVAKEKKAKTSDGKTFWIFQGAEQLKFWLNLKDPLIRKKLKMNMP